MIDLRRSSVLVLSAVLLWVASAGGREPRAGDIFPGDRLSISVFEHPELTFEARVQEGGRIRLPLCGWVDASDCGVGELAEKLSKLYSDKSIEQAFVTVMVSEYGPRTVYVLGEVLEGGTQLEIRPPAELTVTQAVSASGGFTDSADLRHVTVRRKGPDGKTVELSVDVLGVVAGKADAEDLVLRAGDTVIIPRSKPVYLVGEINTPGMHYIGTHAELQCSEMVAKGGGLTQHADAGRIILLRRGKDNKILPMDVDLERILAGEFEKDIVIHPGDMLVIARRKKIYVFGQVNSPGALEVEPGLKLTAYQAVTLSGGFTSYASENSVLLVREGTSDTIDLRKPYREGKESRDVPLKPGDILFVQESMW